MSTSKIRRLMSSARSRRWVVGGMAAVAAAGFGGTATTHATGATNTDQYIVEYADAVFSKHGTELQIAPGQIDDLGTVSEVLDIALTQQTCSAKYLITTAVSSSETAADLPGVDIDARGGAASVSGTYSLSGEITIVPAGRNCSEPNESAAVTAPLTVDLMIDATWKNKRDSVPVVYSGADCGGDGVCYYRDATAKASWSSAFLGSVDHRTSTEAFLFEGTYSGESAALAVNPTV